MNAIPELFFIDRSERGRLQLTGRDRQTFLQGMVSNEVATLKPGQGCYAFLLDATGHVLADVRVLCQANHLLLDVEPGMAAFVAETLEKYLIMERVKIVDVTDETAEILVGGTGSIERLEVLAVPTAGAWREGTNGPIAVGSSGDFPAFAAAEAPLAGPTFMLYCALSDREELLDYLTESKGVPLTPDHLEALRIEAGIPRFGVDIDSRVLAPETGQQKRAIHYRKGCYIGQEIVARIDARGHTNRELTGFWLTDGALPERDSPVIIEDREVGRVTSAAIGHRTGRPIALGYIRHEFRDPGTAVTIGGRPATVAALPFIGIGE